MSFNINHLIAPAYAALVAGKTQTEAARAAAPAVVAAGASVLDLLQGLHDGAKLEEAIKASHLTVADALRTHLESEGVDITDTTAIRAALRGRAWQVEGYAQPLEKTEAAKTEKTRKLYQTVSQRLSRVAAAIVRGALIEELGEEAVLEQEAAQTVETKVPRALAAAMKALVAEHGVKLGRKAYSKALADALAAAK